MNFISNSSTRKYKHQANLSLSMAVLILLLGLSALYIEARSDFATSESPTGEQVLGEVKEITVTTPKASPKEPALPKSYTLKVPYTVQAPFRSWKTHDESCEEAAALMYDYFLAGRTSFNGSDVIPQKGANTDLLEMKQWQVKNYGTEPDLSIKALGIFVKAYYGHNYRTYTNVTKEDIKKALVEGNPVIVPVMTHSLKNPNYGAENSYHVLLIKGYDATGIITNDAGISQGKNWHYSWDVLFSAIDAQKSKMKQGREMIIFTD